MYDFSSYIRISPEPSSPRAPVVRGDTQFWRVSTMQEKPHSREISVVMTTMANVRERTFIIVFGLPLFCAGQQYADLRVVVVVALKDDFFLKTVPDIGYP